MPSLDSGLEVETFSIIWRDLGLPRAAGWPLFSLPTPHLRPPLFLPCPPPSPLPHPLPGLVLKDRCHSLKGSSCQMAELTQRYIRSALFGGETWSLKVRLCALGLIPASVCLVRFGAAQFRPEWKAGQSLSKRGCGWVSPSSGGEGRGGPA